MLFNLATHFNRQTSIETTIYQSPCWHVYVFATEMFLVFRGANTNSSVSFQ